MQNGKTVLKVAEDIVLRLPDPEFAEELFELVDNQRQHLRQWFTWVDKTKDVANTRDFLKSARVFNKGGQQLNTFIFKKDKIIGSIGFPKVDKTHHVAEIGYWLKAEEQGQGIIHKSCKRLIHYAFTHMNINRIEIKIVSKNLRSIAIPKRLDFRHEATIRQTFYLHETYHDMELYGLLKAEWLNG